MNVKGYYILKKGGGLTYVNDFQSQEGKVFRGGLRHVTLAEDSLVYGTKNSVHIYHDKMCYERGWIQHSRSPHNQYLAFHYFYGGAKQWLFERHFKNVTYRKNIRNWWFPALAYYIFGCTTMRMYDNGAYDYFYFIE